MIESLIGSLFGGLFRLAPEVLRWVDRKDERRHELAMFDKQLEADKLRGNQALAQIRAESDAALGLADIQAVIEATRAQATVTGVRWVDALNSLIRPLLTFWWAVILYSVALGAQFIVLTQAGDTQLAAILKLWGPDEKAIAASIISFWFVDRSLRREGSR